MRIPFCWGDSTVRLLRARKYPGRMIRQLKSECIDMIRQIPDREILEALDLSVRIVFEFDEAQFICTWDKRRKAWVLNTHGDPDKTPRKPRRRGGKKDGGKGGAAERIARERKGKKKGDERSSFGFSHIYAEGLLTALLFKEFFQELLQHIRTNATNLRRSVSLWVMETLALKAPRQHGALRWQSQSTRYASYALEEVFTWEGIEDDLRWLTGDTDERIYDFGTPLKLFTHSPAFIRSQPRVSPRAAHSRPHNDRLPP